MSEQQIEELIQVLKNKGDWRTQEVADKLVDIGSEAVQALIECLKDPDSEIRSLAAHLLKRIADRRALPALRSALADEVGEVRKYAVRSLGQIGSQEAIPDIIGMLDDAETEVQIAAIHILGRLRGDAAMQALKNRLSSDSVEVLRTLLLELGKFRHSEMLPILLGYLGDAIPSSCPSPNGVANAAIRAVAEYGEVALPYLLEYLSSSTARVRGSAAWCLGLIGSKSAIPLLLARLHDDDAEVRMMAVRALGDIGDTSVIAHIIPILNIDDPDDVSYTVSAEACRTLQTLGTPEALAAAEEWEKRSNKKRKSDWDRLHQDPRTTEELIRLAVEKWNLRDECFRGFWPSKEITVLKVRGNAETLEAVKALCSSLKPRERAVGAAILGEFGLPDRTFPAECTDFLLGMLKGETADEVLASIGNALGLQERSERIVDALEKLNSHPSGVVRLGVVLGLLWYEDERAIAILMELMKDLEEDVRYQATMGVAGIYEKSDNPQRFDTPEIRQALFEELDDPVWSVKRRALAGLAARRDTKAIDYIVKMLAYDCHMTHQELCEALHDMREHYTGSQELLERALRCCEREGA